MGNQDLCICGASRLRHTADGKGLGNCRSFRLASHAPIDEPPRGKVWLRAELTDEALIEAVGFIRDIAECTDAPHFLVVRAKRIEAMLPPLIDASEAPK